MIPLRVTTALVATVLTAAACNHVDPPAGDGPSTTSGWTHAIPTALPQTVLVDERDGDVLFVAAKGGGLIVLEDGGDHATELAQLKATSFEGHHVMNLHQDGDLLVAALGDFFASASRGGIATIDVSDPTRPIVLDVWITDTEVDGAADVLIDGPTAYVAMMAEGIAIFDVSDPTQLGDPTMIQPDPDFPRANPKPTAHPNARGLALDGNHLYVAYDAGGLRVIDMTTPSTPVEVGRHISPGVRTQQAYNDLVIDGDRAYVSLDYCGMEVVDISDPTATSSIAWNDPWECDTLANLWVNSPGHTNQIVHDQVAEILWVSAGGAELVSFDISDPAYPVHLSTLGTRGNEMGTYGVGGTGERLYLTYVRTIVPFPGTWSGIVAVDTDA